MPDMDDQVIRRLFAAQEESLPADDFMRKLTGRMDRQKRVKRLYRILAVIVCLLLSALGAPWIAQGTSTLIDLTAMSLHTMGPLLYHPLTFFIAAATAIGCSPVIYLWRTGRW